MNLMFINTFHTQYLLQVAREKCETMGRNYFHESSQPGRVLELPGGKAVWFGFFQVSRVKPYC